MSVKVFSIPRSCSFLLSLWLLSAPFSQISAQSGSETKLSFGLKAGLIGTGIAGDVATIGEVKGIIGPVMVVPVTETIFVRVEGLLTGQGARDASRTSLNGRWRYLYINTPVLISVIPFSSTDIALEVGIQPSYLLSARYTDNLEAFNIRSETRTIDLAVLIGASWKFDSKWMMDVRIAASIRDHSLRSWSTDRYFNQSIQLGFTYLLWEMASQ